MSRNNILDITKQIVKMLSDGREHTTKSISYKLKIHWETARKSLEFLKEIDLVKERKGNITYKPERLWSLKRD